MTSPLINYFFTILNMSYTACFVVGAVLLARLLLNFQLCPVGGGAVPTALPHQF